ncbi:MAG TPA: 2-oxo acid dehydrogenase subunit E2, partial [Erysipelothrix sp.]|nr:2-oxo acid dehydrogenase subunit E2 [Erysipelothrix sp.]
MSFVFKMPDLGEGIVEGEIVQWFVKEGDTIEADAPLLEVQNDKMVQEVPSPVSGKVTKIVIEAGNVAHVGDVLVEFDGDGTAAQADAPAAPAPQVAPAAPAGASNAFVFKMPDLGEGIVEGEIVQWFVSVGDTVEADAPLLEVQNDKMVQEVPSPVSGKVTSILIEAGNVANVGDVLVEFDGDGSASSETAPVSAAGPATPASPAAATPQGEVSGVVYADNTVAGRLLALPSVRQYARDNNVDLTQVIATGRHGHVTKNDVDAFLSGATAPQEAPAAQAETSAQPEAKAAAPAPKPVVVKGETTREKMTMTRKAISKAMVNSKHTAPHATLFDEVDVSSLMAHRKKFKDIALEQDVRLTFLAYVVKAVVGVVKKYPLLNASVDDATDEIIHKHFYNIGIAVDTDAGLYVPNIKDADTKSIFAIAKEITELAGAANEGKLKGPDMRDGTITISNIGSARGLWFTPIINHPEVGIFGMGRIDKKPIVLQDGSIGVGSMMALSLSFDHRIIDGMTAQLAMNELKRLLSDPELLLMEV